MIEQALHWVRGVLLSDNMLMTVIVVPVVLALELRWPARSQPLRHYVFGFGYWFTNMFVLAAIAPLLNTAVALGVQHVGLGLIDLSAFGLGGLGGSLVALMVSTFILDFFYYWFHRALHANAYLWQTHLLHHSDEHMNVMTAQRGHIAEGMLAPLFITLPMAVLFKLPAVTIGVLSLVPYMYLFVAHANIKLGFGPLWWVLISPNYHRIHHSIEAHHWDKNFANWFPVWDVIFGTLYRPARDEYPATGVDGVAVKSLGEAFAQPFVGWFRLASRRPTSAGQTALGDSPT